MLAKLHPSTIQTTKVYHHLVIVAERIQAAAAEEHSAGAGILVAAGSLESSPAGGFGILVAAGSGTVEQQVGAKSSIATCLYVFPTRADTFPGVTWYIKRASMIMGLGMRELHAAL